MPSCTCLESWPQPTHNRPDHDEACAPHGRRTCRSRLGHFCAAFTISSADADSSAAACAAEGRSRPLQPLSARMSTAGTAALTLPAFRAFFAAFSAALPACREHQQYCIRTAGHHVVQPFARRRGGCWTL